MKINVINACCDLGVHINGTSKGPMVLKKYLNNVDKIIDCECDCSNKSHDPLDLEKNYDRIMDFSSNMYSEIIKNTDNNLNLVIGGDHSIAVPSALSEVKLNGDIGIIWCDAHVDYNTFETTITGNIHGLPLAAINGLNEKLSTYHDGNHINSKNTVVIGYRAMEDNQDAELNNIKRMGVTVFTTEDVKRLGIEYVVKKAFEIASDNDNKKVHISYDMDLIDPEVAPGVSVPELNGINEEEAYKLLDNILNNRDLISSIDLVEFNPLNDIDNKTEKIAVNLLNKIITEYKKELK